MSEKKYIILTDIKEFTYKNSLLTNSQLESMLQEFDRIVMSAALEYNVSIVKSIWDAYLALGQSAQSCLDFSQKILKQTQLYDDQNKIKIKKIDLRVALTYGEVTKNKSMNLDDYFWECINLASRIIDITPAWKIFASVLFCKELGAADTSTSLWKHSFHGMLTKTEIRSFTKISDKEREELGSHGDGLLAECDNIVFRSACVSAILSAQPIPFVESFNIIAVHMYMILKLSQKLERGVTLRSGGKIFSEVVSPLWAWYFGSQWMNTLAKIFLPWIGWYLYSPISFAVTYATGKIYTAYFFYQMGWETLQSSEMSGIFAKQRQAWHELAKREKKNILKVWRQFYSDVLWVKSKQGYSSIQKDLIAMLKSQKK